VTPDRVIRVCASGDFNDHEITVSNNGTDGSCVRALAGRDLCRESAEPAQSAERNRSGPVYVNSDHADCFKECECVYCA